MLAFNLPTSERIRQKNPSPFVFCVVQWDAQILQQKANLKVRHDKRRGQKFKSEDATLYRLLSGELCERTFSSFLFQSLNNLLQHFDQVSPGTATWIEDEDS